MLSFPDHVASAFFQKREAAEQGGLLSGKDPTEVNTADPIRLWIIQLVVIVGMTQILALGLGKIRQPKVIAEVLGGILLGPTAFGRIPGFQAHIFPKESQSYLSLTANIGLCLFLFLVGLEIDAAVIRRNVRLSASVALAGMVVPFAMGASLAIPLYKNFVDPKIEFTHFMLFTSVAFSITAFPVLCRILTELKLLDTTVGIVVLSAGVGNDIVGWTLLALSVALVNASSGLSALYILLTCVGWTLFLMFPVKIVIHMLARKTGSIENGPTMFFMTVTFLLVFGSAFFTDVIGVHAIFGAFVAGIIIPRENGLAISLTEKFEDMVSIIFLPLYFALSGLSTDLGLLDNGKTWGFTIAICAAAFVGKFGGCALAARYLAGFGSRESFAVGSLMSCKGLVELIVLNVGLSAGILSPRVFSMFVLEALLLTFMTTPLVTTFYPAHLHKRVTTTGPSFLSVPGGEEGKRRESESPSTDKKYRTSFSVVLDKVEHLPAMMAISQLIQPSSHHHASPPSSEDSPPQAPAPYTRISINALRLIELSDRTSAVMKSSVSESLLLHTDPLLSIYRMFSRLLFNNNEEINSATLEVVPHEDLAGCVAEHADRMGVDMVLIPWMAQHRHLSQAHAHASTTASPGGGGEHGGESAKSPKAATGGMYNPFEALWRAGGHNLALHSSEQSSGASAVHSHFVRGVFAKAEVDVGLYVDQTDPSWMSSHSHDDKQGERELGGNLGGLGGGQGSLHLFLPFFGGPDDRLALEFVMQLCAANEGVSASVVRYVKVEEVVPSPGTLGVPEQAHLKGEMPAHLEGMMSVHSTVAGFPDTVYGQHNTETRLQSETADNILWSGLAPPVSIGGGRGGDRGSSSSLDSSSESGPRVVFSEVNTHAPLHMLVERASRSRGVGGGSAGRKRTLVVVGRSRRMAVEDHTAEVKELIEEEARRIRSGGQHGGEGSGGGGWHAVGVGEMRKTIGDVATAVVVGARAQSVGGVVVVQAGGGSVERG